ncbi:MAG: MarR family transcriptional regulator [Dehalococcoidia bacterium]|nr:MarR family transcriptional regulator [Dehalococcoidia bacterium]
MALLTERYAKQIRGVLSCFDRVVIMGTLPGVCYAEGMSVYLRVRDIRLFDYPRFAEPLRDEIRENAERLAQEHGIEIEYIRSTHAFRKEDRIHAILAARGEHAGLVHIFSAMEPCAAFAPWHDKATGRTVLRYKDGKCVHYYFYFIDEEFGLCYLRVPTWAPFRLQFYCNGHNWVARQLRQAGIAYSQLDNAFSNIDDIVRAQALADAFPVEVLHHTLDALAATYCPVLRHFGVTYHWSLMQVEYATDIIFRRQDALRPLYEALVRTAVHAVKPDHVATFLGRKLTGNYAAELGNDFHTRIEGTRIKHHMGPVAIKLYDKQALILRIETTVNDVSFFRHHRTVEHRDATQETKVAPMQKTIYSLRALRDLLAAANRRYLEFLSQLTDPSSGVGKVERLAAPVRKDDRTYRGFNLFDPDDLALFFALARGEWQISGLYNRTLRRFLPDLNGPQVSRLLKRLRLHALIKKVGHTYKYYLTRFGQDVLLTALKLRQLVVIPSLAGVIPA